MRAGVVRQSDMSLQSSTKRLLLDVVIVSGKLRAQGFKSMKFKDGYIVPSGQPTKDYIDSTVKHVLLIQGLLEIKVKAMLDWDPKGKFWSDLEESGDLVHFGDKMIDPKLIIDHGYRSMGEGNNRSTHTLWYRSTAKRRNQIGF
uniref:Ribosomal protein S3 C-terminal domain-containing protein n=1 Tax=Brassica oleracea var. oleracea TaxID=109376 RepID=A0A0D3D2S1_BRAOL